MSDQPNQLGGSNPFDQYKGEVTKVRKGGPFGTPVNVPPQLKVFTNEQALKESGMMEVPRDWGYAMIKAHNQPNQTYFTQDPRRLAKLYFMAQSAPAEWEPPDWFDAQKYSDAFNYLTGATGKTWTDWQPFDVDDPTNIYLNTLPVPPKEFQLPSEVDPLDDLLELVTKIPLDANGLVNPENLTEDEYRLLMQYMYGDQEEVEQSPFMQPGGWTNLETWQQWALGFLNPQPMENRPEWTRWPAVGIQSFQAGMGGMAFAGLLTGAAGGSLLGVPGTVVGATLGLVVGGAAGYQAYTGTEIPVLNKFLRFLDMPAEITEKLIGVAVQTSGGDTQEVFENLPAAFKAAELTYEASPIGTGFLNIMSGGFQGLENVFNAMGADVEWSSGTKAQFKAGEVWALEKAIVEPVMVKNGLLGGAALDHIRSELINGEDFYDLYAYYVSEFGYSGNIGDFLAQSVLDPLQYAPQLVNALGAKYGKMTNNPALTVAFETNMGNIFIDALPMGWQQLAQMLTPKKIHGSGGFFNAMDLYKTFIRTGVLPSGKMPTVKGTEPLLLAENNPDAFRNINVDYSDILARNSSIEADSGLRNINVEGFQKDFKAFLNTELQKYNIDTDAPEYKATIDKMVVEIMEVQRDVLLNKQGKNAAETFDNVGKAIVDYVRENVMGMVSGVKEVDVPYIHALRDFEYRLANLTQEGSFAELEPGNSAKNWFQRLSALNPESQAAIFIDLAHTNLAGIMQLAGDSPARMVSLLGQVAQVDPITAGKIGEAMIKSPASKTIAPALKAFIDTDLPKQMLAVWNDTSGPRQLLVDTARALDMTPGKLLDAVQNDPQSVIRMVQNSRDVGRLKALAADIDSGIITAESLKKSMEPFWGKDAVAWHPDLFAAELVDHMGKFLDKFMVDYYGIEQKSWAFRMSDAMKSFQSLAVLGFNPLYAAYNYMNNMVTRAAEGIWGMLTPGQIDRFWNKMGMKPAMLDVGIGLIGSDKPGGMAVAAALQGNDWITQVHKAGKQASKLGIFSTIAAKIEIAESRQATTIAAMQMMSKLWKDGVGYRPLPGDVDTQLRAIHPRLPEQIYSLVNQGMDMTEITQSLYSRAKFQGIDAALDRAVADIYRNAPDVAYDLIDKTGIKAELTDLLKDAKSAEDINAAFDTIASRLDSVVERATYDDLVARAEDIANRVQAEGWSAMVPLWDEMWTLFTMRQLRDMVDNGIAAEAANVLRSKGEWDMARRVWDARMTQSDRDWTRTHNVMLATAKGMIDAVGTTDPAAFQYIATLGDWMNTWERFYVDKNAELNKFFRGNFIDNAARQRAWDSTQKIIADLYSKHVDLEKTQHAKMFEQLSQMYESTSHRPAGEVIAWGNDVMSVRDMITDKIMEFRETIRNTNSTTDEVQAAFQVFNTEVLKPLVLERLNRTTEGALDLARRQVPATGEAPEFLGDQWAKIPLTEKAQLEPGEGYVPLEAPAPKPKTPPMDSPEGRAIIAESYVIHINEEIEKFNPNYTASDKQRKFLASLIGQAIKDTDSRHLLQRYWLGADSVFNIEGRKVKVALDMLLMDAEGKSRLTAETKRALQDILVIAKQAEADGTLLNAKPADSALAQEQAEYVAKKIQQEADKAARDQQAYADAMIGKDQLKQAMRDHGYNNEQATAIISLIELRAANAGLEPNRYIADRFAAIISAGDLDDALNTLYQSNDFYQGDQQTPRGSISFLDDGRAVINLFKSADISTMVHEIAHIFRRDIPIDDLQVAAKWMGLKDAGELLDLQAQFQHKVISEQDNKRYTEAEDKFAKGFERYLHDELAIDVAPPGVISMFKRFAQWLRDIYKKLAGSGIDVEISPEMQRVYDRLFFQQDMIDALNNNKLKLDHYPTGDTSIAIGVDTHTNYNVQFKIVELADLISSHDRTFRLNKLYPQELQARFRDRPGYQDQVRTIVTEFNPTEVLFDTGMSDSGPMIVGPDLVVESGNGRKIALDIIASGYPDTFQAYISALTGFLDDYGFNPGALDGMEYPVLVRVRLDDVDRVAFANDANAPRAAVMSSVEKAFQDARVWNDQILANLNVGLTQEITDVIQSTENKSIIESFIGELPESEKVGLLDAKGELTRQGVERIKNALLAKVFDTESGQRVLQLFGESADPLVRNFERVVERTLGDLAVLEALIDTDRRPEVYRIADDISDVIKAYLSVKDSGQTIEDWAVAQDIFGGDKYIEVGLYDASTPDDMAKYKRELLHFFVVNRRSINPGAELIKRYVNSVRSQPEIDQMALLPVSRAEKPELVTNIMASLVNEKISKSFLDYIRPGDEGKSLTLWQAGIEQPSLFGQAPPAGTPIPQYDGMMRHENYTESLRPLLDKMRYYALDDMESGTAFSLGDLPPDLNAEVSKWVSQLNEPLASSKLLAMREGENRRNRALLNYQERYGIDNYAQMIFPYEFWFTRTMMEWGKRMIERPAWFAMYRRIREHQERLEQEGIPARFEGRIRIPTPWLPDWAGTGLYIDPFQQLFPFTQFTAPFERAELLGENVQYDAISIIRNMVKEGQLTATQAKQVIETKEGPIWQQALAQAQDENKGDLNAMSLASISMSPAMWWTYPYHLLTDTAEKLYPLPGTRLGQAMRSWGGPLGVIGNIMAFPEESIRKKFNLAAYGEWGDYYIDRMIANMAADGTITPDEAILAMIERQGPAWDLATERAETEWAMKIPGSQTAQAIKAGNLGGVLYTLPTTFFPSGLLPEGELIQRGLKQEYNKAWREYEAGNPKAVNEFFEAHPEYESRVALFKEPEERLRQFLVNEIWERWFSLNNKNKPLVVEQLGQNFEQAFLNDQTRDYSAVDVPTLAYWAQLMGGYVPKTDTTSGITDQPMYMQQDLQIYKPEILAQVEGMYAERERLFPDYKELNDMYWLLPETPKNVRKDFLEAYPMLKEAWDWKDAYVKVRPQIKQYLDEEKKRKDKNLDIFTPMSSPLSNDEMMAEAYAADMIPAMVMQVIFAYYSGQAISGGARTMLMDAWESMGYPGGDFETWLSMVIHELVQ